MTPGSSKWLSGKGKAIAPYVFILPPLAYLAVFMFWPLARQMWLSLTDTRLTNPNGGSFVGLENYQWLFDDPEFYTTLNVTVLYAAVTVVLGVALGTISALAINRPFPGRPLARAIMLFGWAVPNVAASLIWLWMYNERSGVFNDMLASLGLDRVSWLTSTHMAFSSIVAVTVWQVAPFVMLVVLAALQSVPDEVREAARVDGADALSVFRAVTLPHILPSLQLVSLLVAVWSIRRFDIIYLLTGGGPIGSTSTLVVKIRQTAFESHELGVASAYGAIGLILALLVAFVHFVTDRRRQKWMAQ
ncbi:carbohydrate ABC transporter membrane protein 1 (CUT1 family) [Pseudaminobacter salicylatoxidans]|uniref:Carbohydrate ABC transporter membrane protein 1 (CUT1 family) n=1 Tax=Pseudaminobacter salicylatoxidans TaxID=93369 RepID=A0A316CW66_PSESE|nr:sugar ABC transporter permease [Pseudaminobacter salicylatoxidans]PWJ86334.1 carbohydrate ABC transporter membrane protein 1 (CUT1 family) [Pseudaminobacter salicylatoxidans]